MFLFFLDADHEIGLGHFVRCLALAEELPKDSLIKFIVRGNQSSEWLKKLSPSHIHLLTISFESSFTHLESLASRAHSIVLDSYQLDKDFFSSFKHSKKSLLISDSPPDFEITCRWVLNMHASTQKESYKMSPQSIWLGGPSYSLIRREFSSEKLRRERKELKRLFVSCGGAVRESEYEKILHQLQSFRFEEVGVLLSPFLKSSLHLKLQKNLNADFPLKWITPKAEIWEEMSQYDLGICTASTTAYELATLGIPSISLVLEEDHEIVAKSLTHLQAGLSANISEINNALELAKKSGSIAAMSKNCIEHFDGLGARRAALEILKSVSA